MELKVFFLRIFHDKVKLAVIIILFSLPLLEVVQIAWSVHQGFSMPIPHYATFLSLFTVRHHLQRIMFWFLPLYLLIIVSEDTIEDYDIGYHNTLQARVGKRNYVGNKLVGSFTLSFLILFVSLTLNMILVYFCFRNGTFEKMDWQGVNYMDKDLTRITMPHPVITNIVYILITSALTGLIGTVGTAISMVVHSRKLAYGLTFMLWFVPVNMEYDLTLALQPFTYVDYEVVAPTLLSVVIVYIMIIGAVIWMEARDDKL